MATSSISSTTSTASSSTSTAKTAADVAALNKANAQKIMTSLSAGSGVDTASLAQNLVDAERMPKENAINAKIAKNDAKVSGLSAVMFMMSELKTKLEAVKNKSSFNTLTVGNSHPNAFTATATTNAVAGSHVVSITSLAQPQRSVSDGAASATTVLTGLTKLTLGSDNPGVVDWNVGIPSGSSVTLTGGSFGASATVNDFKSFSVTVAGVTRTLTPMPATATPSDLVADLQKQLRNLDGSADLSVSLSGGLIQITSASARVLSNPSLTKTATIEMSPAGIATGTSGTTAAGALSLQNVKFATAASTSDFKGFSLTIGGEVQTLIPNPASPTVADLAADLQTQMRAIDGNNDITVTASGADLVFTSASSRVLSSPVLLANSYDATPSGVVRAINDRNLGVKAELVNTGTGANPFQVMVTGETGATKAFVISSDSTYLAFDSSGTRLSDAADADFTVDGVAMKRSSNTVTDAIAGVTLSLKSPSGGNASLDLSRDVTTVKTNITALVTAYNDANDLLNQVGNPKSTLDTYGATLVGDSTVRMVRQQLRNIFQSASSTPSGGISAFWQLGLSIDEKGVMSADATKLDNVLQSNFSDVVKAMTGNKENLSNYSSQPAGLVGDAVRGLTKLLATDGPLVTRSENANTQNSKYQKELDALKTRMDALLARYTKQFASMDSLVGQINSQKTSLKSSFEGMMAMYTNK